VESLPRAPRETELTRPWKKRVGRAAKRRMLLVTGQPRSFKKWRVSEPGAPTST
jgi:hypothetical protein